MIRPARFADITALCAILEEMRDRSYYGGVVTLHPTAFKQLCMTSIRAHQTGGACLFVAVDDATEDVTGFIMGVVDRVYGVCEELTASDMFFYVRPEARADAAAQLHHAFTAWAESVPGVIDIRIGATNAIGEQAERVGKLYERQGYKPDGLLFRKEIKR